MKVLTYSKVMWFDKDEMHFKFVDFLLVVSAEATNDVFQMVFHKVGQTSIWKKGNLDSEWIAVIPPFITTVHL